MEQKQLIVVRALIQHGDDILLLKRLNNKSTHANKYELPGGKLEYKETPIQAIDRELQEEIGRSISNLSLYDVYSYACFDKHVVGICYKAKVSEQFEPLLNSEEHSTFSWASLDKINQMAISNELQLMLNAGNVDNIQTNTILGVDSVKLYTDGGSRGNPGPSALGYVIYNSIDDSIIKDGSKYLGITTNNQAEYQAVKSGLEMCRTLGVKKVQVFLDSQLVANQMNGIYKIKNRDLWPIHEAIKNLSTTFKQGVSFTYIPRELNKAADSKVNEELDKATSN
jgi:mutator protein MutT